MNRNTVWTPVGLDISNAKSIDEALKMAELDFRVDKKEVYDENGNVIPSWFRNVRSDNNSVLGMVTDRYKVVQNREAFDFVNNLVGEGVQFEKGGVFHKGTAAWVSAKIPTEYNILGDDIESHVVFVNSHNGKGAVKVAVVPNRVWCSNQLGLVLKNAPRTWSIVHSTKVDTRIAEARETLGLADAYMKALGKEADALAMKKVSDAEFISIIDKIYPMDASTSNRKVTNIMEIKNGLLDCLKADDLSNFRGTAWEKMGAVTDFFSHRDAQRNTTNFFDARWESAINGDRDINEFYKRLSA